MSRITDLLDRLLGVPTPDRLPVPIPVRDRPPAPLRR